MKAASEEIYGKWTQWTDGRAT